MSLSKGEPLNIMMNMSLSQCDPLIYGEYVFMEQPFDMGWEGRKCINWNPQNLFLRKLKPPNFRFMACFEIVGGQRHLTKYIWYKIILEVTSVSDHIVHLVFYFVLKRV